MREVAGQLRLSQTITNQALHFLEQLMPGLMGSWRRDLIAAAAVYAVCRANQLPLTLLDLSGAMQLDPFTLGKHYRWALQVKEFSAWEEPREWGGPIALLACAG